MMAGGVRMLECYSGALVDAKALMLWNDAVLLGAVYEVCPLFF